MSRRDRLHLESGCAVLGLDLDVTGFIHQVDAFFQVLLEWNRKMSLIGSPPESWVVRHVLDSLTVVPYCGGRVLDIGSGNGFPGIILGMACPQVSISLLDRAERKTEFLRYVKNVLMLDNVSVVCARVENWRPVEPLGMLLSRAVASLSDMWSMAGHLTSPTCPLYCMKGPYRSDEWAALPATASCKTTPLVVPFLNETRHLVELTPAQECL